MGEYAGVNELHAWRDDWIIKVKVYKRWSVKDDAGLPAMNFIFVDENGNRINGFATNRALSYFEYVCTEGRWVRLTNFRIANSEWEMKGRTTNHSHQIILTHEAKTGTLRPQTEDPFINLVEFSAIYRKSFAQYYPVDLMGSLENIGEVYTQCFPDGETKRVLEFTLKDAEDYSFQCFAYGDFAVDIKERCKGFTGPSAICVLTDWTVKKNIDELTIHEHENTGFSRFLLAPPIDQVYKFRNKITKKMMAASSTQGTCATKVD
ncbi:uncharacterized protein LOC112083976 [Eutrema salsugineum]|uniref:uncharacterized protein LOC112083976 n=1 Tax=Eutrema salsugineum TaxID=72664 RepID=UPI000CED0A7D|nr:uncharacterized protein LOC112083976 [Eutrema salsugineum]